MEDLRLVQFSKEGIQYVRLALVDTSNILRFRIVPISRFLKFIDSTEVRGLFMANAVFGLTYKDHLVVGLPPTISCRGEICLVPDVKINNNNLRRLPYGSGTHALCMVDVEDKDNPGGLFAGCPRSCLKNILKSATDEFGLSFLVGFETEVIFLEKQLDSLTPIDNSTYCSNVALHSVKTSMMIDEIVQAISDQGIGISQFHAESAPGQFEFVTDPYDPITAADNLVRTRETIYNVAAKYDVKATLAPKVFAASGKNVHLLIRQHFFKLNFPVFSAGSGSHCHISIQKSSNVEVSSPGPNAPQGLDALEEHFLSGILKHLRSICAFTLPNVTSYNRAVDHCWAGSYVCWGIDNKEATLRLAYNPGVNRKFRFEVKSVDGTANPYLAVSAIIVAGLDGIRKRLQLTLKEMTGSPDEYETKDKLQKLPGSIEEALSILEELTEYESFCEGMGKTLVDIFIAVRKGETEHLRKLSEEEQLKFVVETY